MYEVIYFSRGGNTRKLASAIAAELGVKARQVKGVKDLPQGADIFLGSSLYLLRPSTLISAFIRENDFKGRKVALFGSSASGLSVELGAMERQLKAKGAVISGKFHCPGKFSFIRSGRPSEKDLEKAKAFARTVKAANK